MDKQELRRLASSASVGPWTFKVYRPKEPEEVFDVYGDCIAEIGEPIFSSDDDLYEKWDQRQVNAAFIAAANPSTVTYLLAEIDRLNARISELSGLLDNSRFVADL